MIFYYYAKLIVAPSAGLQDNYGFIVDTYKLLKSGERRMSNYDRELSHLSRANELCAFCGSSKPPFRPVPVVPARFVQSSDRGALMGVQNFVTACDPCELSKGEEDLVIWWCGNLRRDQESLPRLPLGLYLKIAYEIHKINFTLKAPCEKLEQILAAPLQFQKGTTRLPGIPD